MKGSYGHSNEPLDLAKFSTFAKKSILVGYDSASAVPEISNECIEPLNYLR